MYRDLKDASLHPKHSTTLETKLQSLLFFSAESKA